MSLFKKCMSQLKTIADAHQQRVPTLDNLPITQATEVGKAVAFETAYKLMYDYASDDEPKHNNFDINFGALVSHLSNMEDDAPIKFVVLSGIASNKPLSTLNLTVTGLRKIARVLEAFD